MIDPDFQRAREHAVRFGPLPPTGTPTADILDGDFDTSSYVQSPLAAIKLGRALEAAGDVITGQGEHWATEQIKRIVIQAMVENANRKGMAVPARKATDQIIALLAPTSAHRNMPIGASGWSAEEGQMQ